MHLNYLRMVGTHFCASSSSATAGLVNYQQLYEFLTHENEIMVALEDAQKCVPTIRSMKLID